MSLTNHKTITIKRSLLLEKKKKFPVITICSYHENMERILLPMRRSDDLTEKRGRKV